MIAVGLLFIVAALFLASYNIWDENRAGRDVNRTLKEMNMCMYKENDPIPDYLINPDMEMPVMDINGDKYIGFLQIPSLDLDLPVMAECSDSGLKKAPCRYKGSAYKDDIIIAGHNYKTHFGKLKALEIGNDIFFTDAEGNELHYIISDTQILKGEDVEGMEEGNWDLTMFTCTYGGRERVTVRCKRVA